MTKKEYLKKCEEAWDQVKTPRGVVLAVYDKHPETGIECSVAVAGKYSIKDVILVMRAIQDKALGDIKIQQQKA